MLVGFVFLGWLGGFAGSATLTNLVNEYPHFTIDHPSGGFYVPTKNAIILAETGAGVISSISLTSPLAGATPYYNYVLSYMSSLDLLSRSGTRGGEIRFDSVNGVALRPQGNSWFSSLGTMDWNTFVNLDSDDLQLVDNYNQNAIPQSTFASASWTTGSVVAIQNFFPQAAVPWNYAKLFIYASVPSSSLSMYYVCYTLSSRKTVLGTGWNSPVDVKPNADGSVWWVAESTGVYQVPATSPNRGSASLVIAASFPSALAYDAYSYLLYTVENAPNGRIWVWNGLSATVLYTGVQHAAGMTGDSSTSTFESLILTERDTNLVFQLSLSTLTRSNEHVGGLQTPQHITPANNNNQNALQFYVVDSTAVYIADLNTSPSHPHLTV